MTSFTTYAHVTGSARNIGDDLPFLQTIIAAVYANHAMVYRDWTGPASSRKKQGIKDEDVDWTAVLNENVEAIKHSDFVIVEATQSRFNQGFQVYLAAQYKKPTLIVTRSQIEDRFISGVSSKHITVKPYQTKEELQAIVTKFIKQNKIPEKDLRFNFILNRRIYKYLRDKSYETGHSKSEIIRELLEREARQRE